MIDSTLDYLGNSGLIAILVLVGLSFYFILTFAIFIYKFKTLQQLIEDEKKSLEVLASGGNSQRVLSKLNKCVGSSPVSKELLSACEISLIREASNGISWLSIVSSTAPFIGLFGTVVGILESFAKFSSQSKVSFSVIAPAISEALVATAAGIFVAIFAYTFHQIITRKVYELNTYIKAQSEILILKA
ncbi:MAG: MotA/TolQ/ExbB proton channel family protein [Campylobacteraceae bacterium]|jgi:biopolymer transport protein ExbB/TolQ|nr:MotA/TolQ/ExbB proton channel family protein [Campylobacteraceae bacterium]MBT3882370.1 MotA/TolQ/ExbB proton channel family protein [Campylobacteraceae bacterium]MBT4031254.1 MotA/TolQ/ExbB proton channel family protein [Campylobacteraceae bacterium]MBT4178905.1 MotA/TolQ/ExbB proton channel family protein [Campylobacteraceae bacterium]MBT4573167.1 MotA/TolQ/ExbB proton channel family protein [Campylobacteraceae bacterium]